MDNSANPQPVHEFILRFNPSLHKTIPLAGFRSGRDVGLGGGNEAQVLISYNVLKGVLAGVRILISVQPYLKIHESYSSLNLRCYENSRILYCH